MKNLKSTPSLPLISHADSEKLPFTRFPLEKGTKHAENIVLTEKGVQNIIKLLTQKKTGLTYFNAFFFVLFVPLMISPFSAKAELYLPMLTLKNDFLHTTMGNFVFGCLLTNIFLLVLTVIYVRFLGKN